MIDEKKHIDYGKNDIPIVGMSAHSFGKNYLQYAIIHGCNKLCCAETFGFVSKGTATVDRRKFLRREVPS